MYQDSVFLEIKGDLNEPDIIWGNSNTYIKAYKRMLRDLKIKDGLLVWNMKNGAEIQISENIFDYVIDAWNMQNERAGTGDYYIDSLTYIARLKKTEAKTKTLRWGPSPGSLLGRGHHAHNMSVLSLFFVDGNPNGNLAYYINFKESELSGNGVGDVSLSGTFVGSKGNSGYYICNACAFQPSNDCWANDISYTNNDMEGHWNWLRNTMQLPLVSIRDLNMYYLSMK